MCGDELHRDGAFYSPLPQPVWATWIQTAALATKSVSLIFDWSSGALWVGLETLHLFQKTQVCWQFILMTFIGNKASNSVVMIWHGFGAERWRLPFSDFYRDEEDPAWRPTLLPWLGCVSSRQRARVWSRSRHLPVSRDHAPTHFSEWISSTVISVD